MIYKKVNDMNVSAVVLGTDYYGSTVSEKECMKLIDMYTDFGGNCIDTAKLYVDGKSEEIIGKWLKGKSRDKVIISTKGAHPALSDMSKSRLSEAELEEDLNSSLKRLDCEYIDLYWLHRDDAKKPVGPIIEALNKFIRQGKIRNIGASNWTAERIREANAYANEHALVPFCASQIKWSLAQTSPRYNDDPTLVEMNEKEYAFYKENPVSVFAFASQGKGFFSKMAQGGAEALSEKAKERYYCEKNIRRFNELLKIARRNSISISAAAVSYIYSDKNTNSLAIIGPKNENQLIDTIKYSDFVLTEKERGLLEL